MSSVKQCGLPNLSETTVLGAGVKKVKNSAYLDNVTTKRPLMIQ